MFELNRERYVSLLTKLISEAEHLQNNPDQGLHPEEDRVGDHVEELLKPFLIENGGPLEFKRINFVSKRNNIIIKYKGTTEKTIGFVGSHMDVVPANPEEWQRDPFSLVQEGDKLYGRGTTDCLGHVALMVEMFCQLAEKKPDLKTSVIAVLIANEENQTVADVGVDKLMKEGHMDDLKNGPIYWIDSADMHPCIGSATAAAWKVTGYGKKGHSGLPQNAINPIHMVYEATVEIMRRFHEEFPAHELEEKYNYSIPSTMKITRWSMPPGSLNQIPGSAVVEGDIRMTPFYDIEKVKASVEGYVKEINKDINCLPGRGPQFTYTVGEEKGRLELEWQGHIMKGVYCDIESPGFKAINEATTEVLGESKPYSLTGSLPLVSDLKDAGFDLQISGYGLATVYHGIDEYASLENMNKGMKILSRCIDTLNK